MTKEKKSGKISIQRVSQKDKHGAAISRNTSTATHVGIIVFAPVFRAIFKKGGAGHLAVFLIARLQVPTEAGGELRREELVFLRACVRE